MESGKKTMQKHDLTSSVLVLGGVSVMALVAVTAAFPGSRYAGGALDAFAQCLADQGAIMYGAASCPHCVREKQAFGPSFRLVPYVECPQETAKCIAQGVDGYPTWIFADGRRLVGEQGLDGLAAASGCALPGTE